VLGGEAEAIGERMGGAWSEGSPLGAALGAAVGALAGPERTLGADELEVAVLERAGERRCFRRLGDDEVAAATGAG
jgi:proteasome alpha subunit